MAYIYRLHNNGPLSVENWSNTGGLTIQHIESIPETVTSGGLDKIGTSIPNIFSRMLLFKTAFEYVRTKNVINGNTVYHQMVSDCLDLLQLLFMYGNDQRISYKVWDKNERLKSLENDGIAQHKELTRALKLFFSKSGFDLLDRIVLIYYNNVLVGGTSPLTLVFTSPNWKRKMRQLGYHNDLSFRSSTGDVLFDDLPASITERDREFKIYVYKILKAFRKDLFNNCRSLFEYLDFADGHHTDVPDGYTIAQFQEEYHPIRLDVNGTSLFTGGIQLGKQRPNVNIISDFAIACTSTLYQNQVDNNGNAVQVRPPLFLLQGYANPLLQHNGRPWDPATVVADVPTIEIYNRLLPDNPAVMYPYLTKGDIFSDKIIELPFFINKEEFYMPGNMSGKFLLPIRKEIFHYFSIETVKNNLSFYSDGGSTVFSFKVPLAGGKVIEVSKKYSTAEKVLYGQGTGFNLGVFPFYKLPQNNKYIIGIVKSINIDNFILEGFSKNSTSHNEGNYTERTKIGLNQSVYYEISKDIDYFRIGVNGVQGILMPNFKEINPDNNHIDFSFAVDFGTTNTHIAYKSTMPGTNIEAFNISKQDVQMVLLSEKKSGENDLDNYFEGGASNYIESITRLKLEFLPSIIKQSGRYSFPTRTLVYERMGVTNPVLFGNTNFGFSFHKVTPSDNQNQYLSDLKWILSHNDTTLNREKIYQIFKELTWIIKNKILMNSGQLNNSKIYWLVPESMGFNLVGIFEEFWKSAINEVFGVGYNVQLIKLSESVAPYYGLSGILPNQTVINIDIGGGTTDVFVSSPTNSLYLVNSYQFAGNDIWGDGLNTKGTFDSGFLPALQTNDFDINSISAYISKSATLNSSDLSSYFFEVDSQSNIKQHIRRNAKLKSLLILHLSAIVYKVCKFMNDNGIKTVHHISFTGRGSEYLGLIGSDIRPLVNRLFSLFIGHDIKSTIAPVTNPKEITARGALESSGNPITPVLMHDEFYTTELDVKLDQAREEFNHFLELLPQIQNVINGYDQNIVIQNLVNDMQKVKDESMETMRFNIEKETPAHVPIKSPAFFWYLKHSIYELSKEYNQ